jgi:hypothetical protein
MNKDDKKQVPVKFEVKQVRSSLKLDPTNDLKGAMAFLTEFVKDKGIGVTNANSALTVYLKAQELGIGFANAVDHMHVINGKTGIDIHILKAILLKAGRYIRWTKTMDRQPLYKYIDSTNGQTWTSHLLPRAFLSKLANDDPYYENAGYAPTEDAFDKLRAEGRPIIVPGSATGKLVPVDYVTEYRFEREFIFGVDNKPELRVEISRFYSSDAPANKLADAKSVWVTNRPIMEDHRAFTPGARAIASDLIFGCYDTKELFDMEGVDYVINDQGSVVSHGTYSSNPSGTPDNNNEVTDVTNTQEEVKD